MKDIAKLILTIGFFLLMVSGGCAIQYWKSKTLANATGMPLWKAWMVTMK